MPPPKPPKKALKSMEKPTEKKLKSKKSKKKNYHSFSIYIYKVLKTVVKDNLGITRTSILIMNNFVNDMLETIAEEAARLVSHSKKTTLSSREIQSAIKLVIPGELGKHSIMEGMKALTVYMNSRSQESKM